MRSTDRAQRGASLVESVVASALLGIGVVAGLTAWDTASMSADRALRLAWGNCIARAELDELLAAPYAGSYSDLPPYVRVTVTSLDSRLGEEQKITVAALDPRDGSAVTQAVALKARVLSGGKALDSNNNDVLLGCPAR